MPKFAEQTLINILTLSYFMSACGKWMRSRQFFDEPNVRYPGDKKDKVLMPKKIAILCIFKPLHLSNDENNLHKLKFVRLKTQTSHIDS